MENYKADFYNPETFEKTEIETDIPVYLVNEVQLSLNSLKGYFVSPTMINPETNSVVFLIMDMSDRAMKYKLTISLNN